MLFVEGDLLGPWTEEMKLAAKLIGGLPVMACTWGFFCGQAFR